MILSVSNISKYFDQGETTIKALDDITFELSKSDSLAIIGPSGSGKTTLLSLLAGLDSPTKGEITISNQKITELNEKELTLFRSKNIGIVFQQFHLMPHLTALENVSLPLEIIGENNVNEKALTILKQVGLGNRADHFSHQLSGGENQRVAIARALVTRPKIILADEPSGNLDTETGIKVMDLLFNLTKEADSALILITHDLQLANRCSRKLSIKGGVIQ